MKLLYYRHPLGNFGDDLNLWLWPRLLPGFLDCDPSTLFLGIGTVLNHRIPEYGRKIVFGSGVGYGEVPRIDDRWKVYFVRGPRSAEALGLRSDKAITDAGMLVRLIDVPAVNPQYAISFMPHRRSAEQGDWRAVCRIAEMNYIDPGAPVEGTIGLIKGSRLLVTEAMHGAIVADVLRIPWVPVRAYEHILSSKWEDWCSSVGLEYRPASLSPLWGRDDSGSLIRRGKDSLKRGLRAIGMWKHKWEVPPPARTGRRARRGAAAQLRNLVQGQSGILSQDRSVEILMERMIAQLEALKQDHRMT